MARLLLIFLAAAALFTFSCDVVNAAAIEARDDEVFVTDVSFDRPQAGGDKRDVALGVSADSAAAIEARDGEGSATNNVDKRDRTSAWSTYIGTTDGSYVIGACGVYYNDKSHGACVRSASKCGKKIYAYTGNGHNSKYHTVATVVDVCSGLGWSGVYFTLDSFRELGGSKWKGVLKNVNWKWL